MTDNVKVTWAERFNAQTSELVFYVPEYVQTFTDTMSRHGYYVNDNQPDSNLPVYTFIVPSTNPVGWLGGLSCTS